VWLSEETVAFALDFIFRLVFVTEAKSVYCAVRPESYRKQIHFALKGLTNQQMRTDELYYRCAFVGLLPECLYHVLH
jgi:hypothetical protein